MQLGCAVRGGFLIEGWKLVLVDPNPAFEYIPFAG